MVKTTYNLYNNANIFFCIAQSSDYNDCRGGASCCNNTNKCGEDEGSCNSNEDCKDGLVCGKQNCKYNSGFEWDSTDNCCTKLKGNTYDLDFWIAIS